MIHQGWIGRLAVVAACLVVAGSCGNGDEATTSDPLVQAIAEDVLADPNAPFFSRASADCFAVEIVSSIGEERLTELGFTVDSIPDEFQTNWSSQEVATIIAGLERCADLDEAARGSLPDEMSEGEKDCVLVELGDEFFLDALRAEFESGTDSAAVDAQDEAASAVFFAAIEACIGPASPGADGDPALPTTVAELGASGVIGFESDRDGNPEIYTLDIGTGEIWRMTNDSAYDNAAEWSPDGSRIVFQSNRGRQWDVYSMGTDGNDIRLLAEDAGFPRWSPDGSRIVLAAGDGPDLYTMDPDGGDVVQLTSDPGFDSFPDWSPDGARIVFQSDRNGADEVLVIDADGGNLAPLDSPVFGGGPVWSPDGTRIAFHSSRDGNTDVYVANADGSEVTRLTMDGAIDVFPDWSPDGSFLTFTSDRDGDFEIYVMSADGTRVAQLTDNTDRDFGASWVPTTGPAPSEAGVVSDDPAIWMAEISDLRSTAEPGRIVGFVALNESASSGPPSSPTQPVCVGAGDFITITPGAAVSALSTTGDQLVTSTLRGSAYDGPLGCSMWFSLDLPSSTEQIGLDVAGHQLVNAVDPEDLDASGWILHIWSTPEALAANCARSESLTCALLEP